MAEYVPVGGGLYEKVDKWDPGRVPVTTGVQIDAGEYEDIMRRQEQEAAGRTAEARIGRPKQEKRTDTTGLGKLVMGNLIKI